MEFSNVDVKFEFKRSQRQHEIKILNMGSQVLLVLNQNRNHIFNMDVYQDQQSDIVFNMRKDPVKKILSLYNITKFIIYFLINITNFISFKNYFINNVCLLLLLLIFFFFFFEIFRISSLVCNNIWKVYSSWPLDNRT
jgi:hypothetical protein